VPAVSALSESHSALATRVVPVCCSRRLHPEPVKLRRLRCAPGPDRALLSCVISRPAATAYLCAVALMALMALMIVFVALLLVLLQLWQAIVIAAGRLPQ
jgi:hypothetical protein